MTNRLHMATMGDQWSGIDLRWIETWGSSQVYGQSIRMAGEVSSVILNDYLMKKKHRYKSYV